MSQFRNKTEAQQAIQDMEKKTATAQRLLSIALSDAARSDYASMASASAAEAARIRALLPTLPD